MTRWRERSSRSRHHRSVPAPVSGGGFEQCYNAQAVVAEGSLLVVASDVARAPNDKQQLEPMLAKTRALPEELARLKPCWPITAISARPM